MALNQRLPFCSHWRVAGQFCIEYKSSGYYIHLKLAATEQLYEDSATATSDRRWRISEDIEALSILDLEALDTIACPNQEQHIFPVDDPPTETNSLTSRSLKKPLRDFDSKGPQRRHDSRITSDLNPLGA